jgi:Putative auto-transporter adhesin, head GIN domain
MITRRHLHLGLLPLLAALTACSNFVEGNGVWAERVFDASTGLPQFSSAGIDFPGDVDVSGHPLTAPIRAGTQAREVRLSGDENVIEHIKVQVDGSGRLYTTIDVDGYSSVHPPQLRVDAPGLVAVMATGGSVVTVHEAPGLVAVEATGGSVVTVHDAPEADLAVTASDRGQVTLVGSRGGALEARVSGGAVLDAAAYDVRSSNLTLTGASTATVWPEQDVTGSVGDGGTVFVKGGAGCNLALSGSASCGPLSPP